jgi:diguanylate cyclase (GGDEF)-like protein/PAS domain S-box-containing protein
MKFSVKLTVFFSAIMLIIGAFTSYLDYSSNLKHLEKEIKDNLEERAFHTLDKIDRIFYERYVDMKALASDSVISSRSSTPGQITERLREHQNRNKVYASMSFFDLNRIRLADTTGKEIGKQYPLEGYWKDISGGKDFVVTIHKSISLKEPVLFFVSVVRDKDGTLFGIVVARIIFDNFYDIVNQAAGIHKFEETTEVDLLDKKGLILFSNYNPDGINKEISHDWEFIKDISADKKVGSIRHICEGRDQFTTFANEQGYLDYKGNDWKLVLCVPTKSAFASIVELRNKMIIIFLTASLIAAFFIYFFSRTISKPVENLTKASAEVAKGKLDVKVEVTSEDELGQLAESFNKMVMELKESRDKLLDNSRDLEIKVEKRTAELKRLGYQQELILSSAAEGIFGLDVHGNHTIVNPAAAQMLGYAVDELIGRHSHTTWHYKKADGSPYSVEECPIYAAFKDGRVHHITDEVFWRKDGTSFPVEYTGTPITEDGKISGAVVTFRDISERKHMEEELRALSLVDELTGLYNRRGFLTLVKQQTKIADRLGKEMLLIFADIDKMKLINDTLGHKEGDRALIDTANILRKSLRDLDIIARFGGDEFVVLAMEACSEHAEIIYSHLQDNIKSHNEKEDRPYKISLSLGSVCYVPGSSIEEFLVQADNLMYEDKQKKQVKSDEI